MGNEAETYLAPRGFAGTIALLPIWRRLAFLYVRTWRQGQRQSQKCSQLLAMTESSAICYGGHSDVTLYNYYIHVHRKRWLVLTITGHKTASEEIHFVHFNKFWKFTTSLGTQSLGAWVVLCSTIYSTRNIPNTKNINKIYLPGHLCP